MNRKTTMRRGGFTFSEVLVAVMLFGLVTAFVVPGLIWLMRFAAGGSHQADFTMTARQSELRIAKLIRSGRAVVVYSNRVDILSSSTTVFSVYYEDLDDNPTTMSNNVLRFDPDATEDDDEETICNFVCPIPGEAMFTNINVEATDGVRFRYHVGEGDDAASSSLFSSSPGFQGVEVRFSATQRNVQTWYD